MDILNNSIVEAIRNRYAAPTAETVAADSDRRKGVMSRTKKQVDTAMESTAQDALATVAQLMRSTREARTFEDQETPSLDYYQGEDIDSTADAEIAADSMRDSMPDMDAISVSDGKDDQESAPVTAETGLMGKPAKGTQEAITEAKSIVKDKIGIPGELWDAYRQEVSAIESGGLENPYAAKGGANKHYDGMYQLGKVAKQDASKLLGITLSHDASAREAYRSNPALQEKAFAAYTAKNHAYLTSKSAKYRELPMKEKLAVLGYAHNQGWGGAKEWLSTGVEGKDAFGTKGTKYYNAITKRLGD